MLSNFNLRTPKGTLGRLGERRSEAEFERDRQFEYQLKDYVTAVKHGPLLKCKRMDI